MQLLLSKILTMPHIRNPIIVILFFVNERRCGSKKGVEGLNSRCSGLKKKALITMGDKTTICNAGYSLIKRNE